LSFWDEKSYAIVFSSYLLPMSLKLVWFKGSLISQSPVCKWEGGRPLGGLTVLKLSTLNIYLRKWNMAYNLQLWLGQWKASRATRRTRLRLSINFPPQVSHWGRLFPRSSWVLLQPYFKASNYDWTFTAWDVHRWWRVCNIWHKSLNHLIVRVWRRGFIVLSRVRLLKSKMIDWNNARPLPTLQSCTCDARSTHATPSI